MEASARRFACTQCGRCCDRSPEILISEAAALSDVFVFRLLFRIYVLQRSAHVDESGARNNEAAIFYQRKRLLNAYAARKSVVKGHGSGKATDLTRYLVISALSVDGGLGACSALAGERCGIYDRRPFACRTAPFHYSRPEASTPRYLDRFTGTPGYRCDTGRGAPVVIDGDRIVDPAMLQARADAADRAKQETAWQRAIVRRMTVPTWNGAGLPRLDQVATNAALGGTTISMRLAWQIAVEAGLMDAQECNRLLAAQLAAIEHALAEGKCNQEARRTFMDMRAEYLAAERG